MMRTNSNTPHRYPRLIPTGCYFLILLLSILAGCAATRHPSALHLINIKINQDSVWQGQILIEGSVEVLRGATLTILPGTEIKFARLDADGDWLGDSSLLIKGALHAEGTRQQPIVFRSAEEKPRAGDWKEIRVDFAREVTLKYCEIRDSVAGLHAHYTSGLMENCRLQKNIDGSRFGEARFTIRNCLIEQNEAKGILTRQSTLQLEKNIFRDNGTGLFFMENDRSSRIEKNNFYANQYHLRLGDFSTASISIQTSNNWFGSAYPLQWQKKIYDQRQDPKLGRIMTKPATSWRPESGPQDRLALQPTWQLKTDGFIDASPLVVASTLYAASWDGHLYALDSQGRLLWKQPLGDVVDASPVAAAGQLFLQNWQRQVVALSAADGSARWRFSYPESPADDHRQGALLPIGDLVLLPAWGGTLYALDALSGSVRWQQGGHLPLRAAPVTDGSQIYLSAGDGTVTAISLSGKELWSIKLSAPLLTSAALTPDGPVVVARDGQISAFTADGRLRWRRELTEPCYYSAPLYHQGMIYLATAAGKLRKLNAVSGELVWTLSELGAFYGSPMVVGQRLFIGNNSGLLYAINLDSAEILTTYQVGRDIQTTPVLFAGQLIFGSRDGNLYALELIENSDQEMEK